ncbi:MAG: hypothetical protein HRT57_17385 [Crocinitomicaceae bacterium]|nr:hypothetical protein [Crocinitomicaceae bacterium]
MHKLLTALAITLSMYSFSQQQQQQQQQQYSTDSVTVTENNPTDWELYIFNADFKIEYKFETCNPEIGFDTETVLLKITNRTRKNIAFNWHTIMYFTKECKTCDFVDEYSYTVNVPPLQMVEGSCDMYADYQLKIPVKFVNTNQTQNEPLRSFELRNLTVTEIQVD